MKCPKCRLINPETALRCDCGYDFASGTMKESYLVINKKVSEEFIEDYVKRQAMEIHSAACPLCNGMGPTDVYISNCILSGVLICYIRSTPYICCRKCGRIKQIRDLIVSILLGWWSFPRGILMTPVQIIRNLIELFREIDPSKPSNRLYTLIQQQAKQKFK